jgi:hypothetical protein
MYEIKSKKTGHTEILSEEEFDKFSKHYIFSRFSVKKLDLKPLIPSLKKEIIKEKTKIKKE